MSLPLLKIEHLVTRFYTEEGVVKAPTYCIDYVITHELCHLKHPHHRQEFYELLSRCMPDWKARKKRLEEVEL